MKDSCGQDTANVLGFLLLWWNTLTENNLERKGFIWLILPHPSPSLKEIRAGTQKGQEPGSRSWCRSPQWAEPSSNQSLNHLINKMSRGCLPTDLMELFCLLRFPPLWWPYLVSRWHKTIQNHHYIRNWAIS